jgi:Ca2+-binding EF-hand superfamily protein
MADRKEEIENEFELVDFKGKGTISKQEFVDYLNEKHRQIDLGLLDTVLKGMRWDYRT